MKTLKTVPGQNLVLGHRGENLATRIIFSIAPWVETYGPGTAHLLHQRQGDSEPYPVATLQEGTEVSWDVTDGDTALEGYGKYELRYYVAETLVKSSVGETYTMKALQYGAEPPDPIQGWVDHVLEKENEIYEAASETKGYSEAAERAAGDALNFANAADQSAGNARLSAKTAADQAGQAAGSAKEAKEAAEEARKIVDGADVVKSVNGQGPDENGNVQIEVGTGSGVDVTAKPGQLIRVKSVDENGKPTAWEAVPWGYTEGGMVEILPECQPTYIEDGEGIFVIEEDLALVAGRTYIVNWNGTEYTCIGQDMSATAPGAVLLGNLGAVDGTIGTGEPFVIVKENAWVAAPLDGTTELTLAISQKSETVHPIPGKLLPEGVPYIEGDGAATDTLTFDGNIEGTGAIEVDDGMYYIPMSTEYVESTELIGGTLTSVGLAEDFPNGSWTITEDMIIDMSEMAGVPYYSVGDLVAVLAQDLTLDGITLPKGIWTVYAPGVGYVSELKAPSAVFGSGETIHKLDNRCLDLAWLPTMTVGMGEVQAETALNQSSTDIDTYYFESTCSFEVGKNYTIIIGDVEYDAVAFDGAVIGLEIGTFLTDNIENISFVCTPGEFVSYTSSVNPGSSTTIKILGETEIHNKLPKEFLPDDVGGGGIFTVTGDATTMTANKTADEILRAMEDGKNVLLSLAETLCQCIGGMPGKGAFFMMPVPQITSDEISGFTGTNIICVKPDGSIMIK